MHYFVLVDNIGRGEDARSNGAIGFKIRPAVHELSGKNCKSSYFLGLKTLKIDVFAIKSCQILHSSMASLREP